jgi:hypothetical protein
VLLLKKGNDIEKTAVFEELDKYNEKTRWTRRWYSGYYGSYGDFDSSGAAIITNAKEEIRKLTFEFIFFYCPRGPNEFGNHNFASSMSRELLSDCVC